MCPSFPRIILVDPSCPSIFSKCPSLNITWHGHLTTNLSQPTQCQPSHSPEPPSNTDFYWLYPNSPPPLARLTPFCWSHLSRVHPHPPIHCHHIQFPINAGALQGSAPLNINSPSEFHPHPQLQLILLPLPSVWCKSRLLAIMAGLKNTLPKPDINK